VAVLQPCFHAAPESVHLSRPDGLTRKPLWRAIIPRILATYSGNLAYHGVGTAIKKQKKKQKKFF